MNEKNRNGKFIKNKRKFIYIKKKVKINLAAAFGDEKKKSTTQK